MEFTIIRPGGLKTQPATGRGVLTEDSSVCGAIHREDVADLLVHALFSDKTKNKVCKLLCQVHFVYCMSFLLRVSSAEFAKRGSMYWPAHAATLSVPISSYILHISNTRAGHVSCCHLSPFTANDCCRTCWESKLPAAAIPHQEVLCRYLQQSIKTRSWTRGSSNISSSSSKP